jgi:hypothetical protein
MAIALVLLMALLLVEGAWAGSYRVAQCGWGLGAELDPSYPATEGTAFSLNAAACAPAPGSGPAGMRFEGGVAPDGSLGLARARWVAPAGTRLTDARLTWSGSPQPGNWEGLAADVGGEFQLLASGFTATGPAAVDLPMPAAAWAFEAFLQCLLSGPQVGCTRSAPSTMRLSGLTLTVEDPQAPAATLGGALVAAGWHRGTAALELGATDVGAGVAGATATLDGAPVLGAAPGCAAQTIEGEARATKMQPCPSTASQAVVVDTAHLADGAHTLRGCATDFAGDQGCAPDAVVEIDNSPPGIAFVDASAGEVAVAVNDPYSGPAAGTISVRHSESEPWTDLPTSFRAGGGGTATLTARLPELSAGTWLFRAVAADVAGNSGEGRLRVAGASAAEVRRQVATAGGGGNSPAAPVGGRPARRRDARLEVNLEPSGGKGRAGGGRERAGSGAGRGAKASGAGLTVDYGTAVGVRGRLTDSHGAGIARRPVAVFARAAGGIGLAPERRRVLTDRAGRFDLRLPAGTSRRVSVAFRGGGGFGPARRRSLALRVRAGLSLAAEPTELRTGEAVRLRGRVHLGPAGLAGRGKLVAIQYLERASGRWRPALVVRTDREGRFDTTYRFRYVTDLARIRLRATAPAEGGWPFARGSSPPVTVTVRGR